MHHKVRKKTGSAGKETQQSSPSTDSYERTLLSSTNLLWCVNWEADTTCSLDTQQRFHTLPRSQNKAWTYTVTAASKDFLMSPALPALCGERHVSVVLTGTDFQIATRYESTFACVYILLKPFYQFSIRTGEGRGRGRCSGQCGKRSSKPLKFHQAQTFN